MHHVVDHEFSIIIDELVLLRILDHTFHYLPATSFFPFELQTFGVGSCKLLSKIQIYKKIGFKKFTINKGR